MNFLGPELAKFSEQIEFAMKNYTSHGKKLSDFKHIVISGLGGSGITGKILKSYYLNKINIPVETVSDYQLPAFVNADSLVILCSYSGNTEETLSAYADARKKGAYCLALTVGGKIADLAEKDGVIVYRAEGGYQPRVAFGYPITYMFMIFAELLGENLRDVLSNIKTKVSNTDNYIRRANYVRHEFRATIRNKYVIIASPDMEALAIRFAQQVQENAKLEAFVVVIPEANHNVIESYYQKWASNYIMMNSGENARINLRFQFIKDLLESQGSKVLELDVKPMSIEHIFDVVFVMDWVSLQIADEVVAVSNQIKNIIDLKNFLSNQ
ncbi:MAG: SIS domain-containing protein [bacterium]|jgi:glucose/mannose-6-phosphate isomerase